MGEAPALGSPRLELGSGSSPGWRGELLVLGFFALATLVLTWPIAVTLDAATGLRGDYFNNLWNSWWVRRSIAEGHSPYWTDYLFYPDGISLKRHTLSPVNSLAGALLGSFLSAHAAFNLVLLAHFALSGWAFSLLARSVTGSRAGAVLGGLVYSFCPFHYFYLCQINVFTFEFIPLALFFLLKHHREGGRGNLVGVALALAGMAASAEYYVVYTYMVAGILVLVAGAWAPEVAWRTGLARFAVAGGLGAAVVALVALPLLHGTLGPEGGAEIGTAAYSVEKHRVNDLFGFYWLGGPEECFVSWPTMLGYSSLLLIALGFRRVLAHWPWLLVGLVFFVLSLGETLSVGGKDTGFPMPYAVFRYLPVLSMLRKSDRCFMVVQLVAALLVAAAWAGSAARLRSAVGRGVAWCATAALLAVELCGAPFGRYDIPVPPYYEELAGDPDVRAILELPAERTHVANGRFLYYQMIHGKKTTLGYTTALAVTTVHDRRIEAIVNIYWNYLFETSDQLPGLVAGLGVDRVVHHTSAYLARERDPAIDGRTIWAPFFLVRRPLIHVRQIGQYESVSLDAPFERIVLRATPELARFVPKPKIGTPFLDVVRSLFPRAFGPPLVEDDQTLVYSAPRR